MKQSDVEKIETSDKLRGTTDDAFQHRCKMSSHEKGYIYIYIYIYIYMCVCVCVCVCVCDEQDVTRGQFFSGVQFPDWLPYKVLRTQFAPSVTHSCREKNGFMPFLKA